MDRDRGHLFDILASARTIRSYVAGVSRQEFLGNMQLQDSVIRRLEILGEAEGRVSSAFREANPEIRWAEIRGMRNRMIHRYDDVDMDIVWDTVVRDVPNLVQILESLVPPESG